MLTCHFMGGLGNQLFQAAVTLSLGKEYKREVVFPLNTDQSCSRKVSYNSSYFHKLHIGSDFRVNRIVTENGFSYTPICLPKGNVKLKGYYQSDKYFNKHKSLILDTFVLPERNRIAMGQKYKKILEHPSSVSIHIRRGDYLKFPDIHYVQPITYYEKAVKHFNSKSLFVIFSDDIEWCKNQEFFKTLGDDVIFIKDMDYNELYLMSVCKHNIIANSSFSWWGAYLNKHQRKKVIAPKQWFGPKGPTDIQDGVPDGWIVIS